MKIVIVGGVAGGARTAFRADTRSIRKAFQH